MSVIPLAVSEEGVVMSVGLGGDDNYLPVILRQNPGAGNSETEKSEKYVVGAPMEKYASGFSNRKGRFGKDTGT